MFRPLRERFDPLCRHVIDVIRPFALDHRLHKVRETSVGRHLLENRAKRRLGRVCTRDFQSTEASFLVHHINRTPVGDMLERRAEPRSPASARIRATQTAGR